MVCWSPCWHTTRSPPPQEPRPCQNRGRCGFHNFWNNRIWWFHFLVVHDNEVFLVIWGLGIVFQGCRFHVFLSPWLCQPLCLSPGLPANIPPGLHPNVPPNQPQSMCRSFACGIFMEEASPLSMCSLS